MTNWTTKPKIAIASAVLGLFVGIGMGGPADDEAAAEAKGDSSALAGKAETSADAQVKKAKDEAARLVSDVEQASDATVAAAVAEAVAAEKSKRKSLIKAAVSKAKKEAKAANSQPKPVADTSETSTDPRFDTCGDANAAGYGNYRQGTDPEYGWYQDRDNDGSVCE